MPFILSLILGYLTLPASESVNKEGDEEEGEVRKRTVSWIVGLGEEEEDDLFDEEWLERRRERTPLIGRMRRISCLTV
jgi:hypothetical protein